MSDERTPGSAGGESGHGSKETGPFDFPEFDGSEPTEAIPDLDSPAATDSFPELDATDESLPSLAPLPDDDTAETEAVTDGALAAAAVPAVPAVSTRARSEPTLAEVEEAKILEITKKGIFGRLLGYAKMSGPGFIQSSITLGAATATSSFYLGATFGYSMLWVQILGMLMGVLMFAAVARPTLCRSESIYVAMGRHVHPLVAIAWALASIGGSIVWCLSQYATATVCLADVGVVFGFVNNAEGDPNYNADTVKWIYGALILAVSIPLTLAYGGEKGRGVRIYERVLKCAIAFMVLCFVLIAWKTGIDWEALGQGLIPDVKAVAALERADLTKVLGALGCAVGINMTFLFPISLRARGWGRHHIGAARFDLGAGMFIPFAIISTLVVIASANLLQGGAAPKDPTVVSKLMDPLFADSVFPAWTGRVLFDLGIAAMPLSTITILMLISGLALREMMAVTHGAFGREGSSSSRLWFTIGALLPTVGIVGSTYKAPFWLGPLISSFALVLLPIAYFGFLCLHNSKRFLGKDMPTGFARLVWNVLLVGVLIVTVAGASLKVFDIGKGLYAKLSAEPESSAGVETPIVEQPAVVDGDVDPVDDSKASDVTAAEDPGEGDDDPTDK